MAVRRNRRSDAAWQARSIRNEIGREIRESRTVAGVSLLTAGAAVGMSHSQLGRIERAELTNVTVDQLCRACAAVGFKLVVRAFPDGDPVRDSAQLALIGRFRDRLPAGTSVTAEAPLPAAGDRRAWDLLLGLDPVPTAVEAESRLRDVQAVQRRIALKQRDGGIERVILLVNDTAFNRRVLALHREDLRVAFPLSGRDVLAAVVNGRSPAANGLVAL
jgi:transcriptional regulator with XRE-family HTH domain